MFLLEDLINENVSKAVIVQAIKNKWVIEFDYNVGNKGRRIVEPHAVGMSKANNLVLRAYPIGGKYTHGTNKFKLFSLKDMSNLTIKKTTANRRSKDEFNILSNLKSRPNINYSGDKSMKNVYNISEP